ncbi:MarR family protein [compost metagenome]
MKENKEELLNRVMQLIMDFKKIRGHQNSTYSEINHSKKLTLLILHRISEQGGVSLSALRKELLLAPSTITSIISSLEKDELIERVIDKSDRRNIYIEISPKGIEYTKKAYTELEKKINNYIEYMGVDDVKELVRLMTKTKDYFQERKEC